MDCLGKVIVIESRNGNEIMRVTISEQGAIELFNCEVADIDNNVIRIQEV